MNDTRIPDNRIDKICLHFWITRPNVRNGGVVDMTTQRLLTATVFHVMTSRTVAHGMTTGYACTVS